MPPNGACQVLKSYKPNWAMLATGSLHNYGITIYP